MTEADLSPLLSKSSPEPSKDKKDTADKTEKKEEKEKKEKKEKREKKDKEEKKEKKDKEGKKEKKRSRQEMEEEEDEIEEQVVEQTKSNGVEESAAAKKEKSKLKNGHVMLHFLLPANLQDGKVKKRKIAEAEEAVEKVVPDDGLDKKALNKLERKKAKLEGRAERKAKKARL